MKHKTKDNNTMRKVMNTNKNNADEKQHKT